MSTALSRCLLALLVFGVSLGVRVANETRLADPADPDGGWVTFDPDGHYHMRRLERALQDGGRVAGSDPFLAYPDGVEAGTPIPWPPYATHLAWALAAGWVGEPDAASSEPAARRGQIERLVGTLPLIFSALASAVVALAAAALVRRRASDEADEGAAWAAGAFAGLYHAFAFGSIRYGSWGNGDHHALVALLEALLFLGVAAAVARGWKMRGGALVGVALGLALGTWVASALYGAVVAVTLGALGLREGDDGRRAVHLGSGLCAGALLAVFPAVLASPWPDGAWLNLSTTHAACLASGFVVFRAAAWMRSDARRRLWLIGCGAGVLVLFVLPSTPMGVGVREGLEWSRAANDFMGRINESQPLHGLSAVGKWIGLGLLLAPLAWLGGAAAALRGRGELVVWLVAVPALLPFALAQQRFAEAVVVPLAVLVGWAVADLSARWSHRAGRPAAWRPLLPLIGLLGAGLHFPMVGASAARLARLGRMGESPALVEQRELRTLARDLRALDGDTDGALLAHWDRGHLFEWVAEVPTVATGFGLYVGEDAFLDPWRFFLERDPAAAEELLRGRGVRWVFAEHPATHNLDAMVHALHPEDSQRWLESAASGDAPWTDTMAARLVGTDLDEVGRGLGFLRLVAHGDHGFLYEVVEGARVELAGDPGARWSVRARVPMRGQGLDVHWRASGRIDADGIGRVRVPHGTREDGAGVLFWEVGGESGELVVPPAAVRDGGLVRPR